MKTNVTENDKRETKQKKEGNVRIIIITTVSLFILFLSRVGVVRYLLMSLRNLLVTKMERKKNEKPINSYLCYHDIYFPFFKDMTTWILYNLYIYLFIFILFFKLQSKVASFIFMNKYLFLVLVTD
jgi:hypothetical protein